MRDFVLMLVFAWQAVTAPFYSDPAAEIKAARQWLEQNVKHVTVLTSELIAKTRAASFNTGDLGAAAFQAHRNVGPWRHMPVLRLYSIRKRISSRPAWAVTDVRALLALDENGRVLAVHISSHRTSL